ncbi:MAG: T9SS type A sorting domain-containing protein [Bacteroidales bacterium]|nr:T9SS type A sorting domain-containing protein [Bacteroidales bacterium]
MKTIFTLILISVIGISNIYSQNNDDFTMPTTTTKNIVISPNPSTDYINISGLANEQNYIIFDMVGQVVVSGTIRNEEKINIQNFKSGLYILKFSDRTILKFIKE